MNGSSNARHSGNMASSSGPVQTGKVEVPEGGGPVDFPALNGQYISFKAGPDNEAPVYIHGGDSDVGWPLDSNEETGLKPVANAQAYRYSGTEGDEIYYELIG